MSAKNKKKTEDIPVIVSDTKKSFLDSKFNILIIIILIFVLGFAIRSHLLKYDYMFEFDTYWHLRATGYVVKGELPENDPLGFYQQGGINYSRKPQLLWHFTALIYKLFTFGASYDKWLLMSFARYLPAIFGALISVALFFLGKEMYNKKVGLVMGIVAATIPAFVYRTMAGFFEEDALGFLWLVIGLIFLVKAIKNLKNTKQHLTYALISVVFFVIMSLTWDMFLLIPLVLVSYFFTNIIYMAFKNITNNKIAIFIKIMLITLIMFSSVTTLFVGTSWINKTTNYVSGYLPVSSDNIDRINKVNIPETDVVSVTVGEENTGHQFFLMKYNLFIIIPFLALLLMIIYFIWPKLFGFEKNHIDYLTLIIFFWLLITLFMAWVKLKFTYTLGLPIAAGMGFIAYLYFNFIKNKSLFAKRLCAIIIAFFLIGGVASGAHFVSTNVPTITNTPGWLNTFDWINENTPTDIKIMNWWDYGHWITYFTERKASTDNTNSFFEGTSDFARFVINDDLNVTLDLLKKYDADYVLADSTYFSKYNSFALYAHKTTNMSDPKVTKYFGARINCVKESTIVTNKIRYDCQGNYFTEDEFNSLPTTWQEKPKLINNTLLYLYKSKDNSEMYFLNPAINNSIFAKIWFKEESVQKYISEIYSSYNTKTFKVNKEEINKYFENENYN
jgi:asparagine N-glycosylation enzyme membrane subunit Stt3